jgi:hypothetical protein
MMRVTEMIVKWNGGQGEMRKQNGNNVVNDMECEMLNVNEMNVRMVMMVSCCHSS